MRLVDDYHRIIKWIACIPLRHTLQFLGAKTVVIDEIVLGMNHLVDLAVHAYTLTRREFSFIVAGFGDIHHPCATIRANKLIIGEHQNLR